MSKLSTLSSIGVQVAILGERSLESHPFLDPFNAMPFYRQADDLLESADVLKILMELPEYLEHRK